MVWPVDGALHAHHGIAQAPLDQVEDALVDAEGVAQEARVDPRVTLQCLGQQAAGFIVAASGNQVHGHRAGQHHEQVDFIGGHAREQFQAHAAAFFGAIGGAQFQAMHDFADIPISWPTQTLQALGDVHGVLEAGGGRQQPGIGLVEVGVLVAGVFGNAIQPAQQQACAAAVDQGVHVLVQAPGGFFEQTGIEQMLDRRDRLLRLEKPLRSGFMQAPGHAGVQAIQCMTQETGKQVVIAEPLLLAVYRYQEQVGAVQMVEHRAAVAAAGYCFTQRHTELVEDAGLHQEHAAVFALPREDVLGQVLGQFQVGTGKRGNEFGVVGTVLERKAGQVETGDPAFGAAVQGGQLIVAQGYLPLVANERDRFFRGEAQITRANFQQLASCTNAPQADARR
ncbi:hypothetical protein D3C85_865720 [compost metagenome]